MTHDELLAKIEENRAYLASQVFDAYPSSNFIVTTALRTVVELHKPDESDFPDEWESCVECSGNGYSALYPCETIKAIEKELG
jgi:hypothetical protein